MAQRVVGHAWRGMEDYPVGELLLLHPSRRWSIDHPVAGHRRFVCECGGRGRPVLSTAGAKRDHRLHKREVSTPMQEDE